MNLANADGVHFCFIGGGAIFLDLKRDRYIAAGAEIVTALEKASRAGDTADVDRETLQLLISNGLLVTSSDPAALPRATEAASPTRELADLPRACVRLLAVALACQLRSGLELHRKGLGAVIAARQQRGLRDDRHHRIAAKDVSAAFAASNLIFSAHERCLLKSIALYDMLDRAGHRATLVIGVRDNPFNAHAWVQLHDFLLNDSVERVSLYRPILIV